MNPVCRFVLLSFSLLVSTGSLTADTLKGFVPVVGSTAGAHGGNFKTEFQLNNQTDQVLTGRLVFHPAGQPAGPDDPSLSYQLFPHETRQFDDIVVALGATGLGSLDIFSDGELPMIIARAYQDDGPLGTKGITLPVLDPAEVPGLQQIVSLVAPRDMTRFRFNIGIRTLGAVVTVGATVYRSDGSVAGNFERTYPANYFEQSPANDFLGMALQANDSIDFQILEGAATFYGTTTDNKTNDSHFQFDHRFNSNPVFEHLPAVQTTMNTSRTVIVIATDADGDPLQFGVISGPSHGTVGPITVDGGTASFDYMPAAGYTGNDSLIVEADDGNGGTNQAAVQIIVGTSQMPTAQATSAVTDEEMRVIIILRGSDPEGDPLSFSIVSNPRYGVLSAISPRSPTSASVSYTPALNYSGGDSFIFKVEDPTGGTGTAMVSISIQPVNDPPVGSADAYSVNEDSVLTVGGRGVVSNDSDVDGDALSVSLVTNVSNGLLALNPNGSFSYTPDSNFFGTDSFTYSLADPAGATYGPVTATLTINPVNDAASFTIGASQTVDEDAGAQSVPNWITVFSVGPVSESGQSGSFEIVSNDNPSLFSAGPLISPAGTLSYTPAPNASGAATIGVRLRDDGGTANGGIDVSDVQTFTITVNPVNDLPVATSDSHSVDEDNPLNVAAPGVLGNDTDADSGSLTAVLVTGPANAASFALDPSGSFNYMPNANFTGTDSFTYQANDGAANSNIVMVTITVNSLNDVPVANDDSYTMGKNTTLTRDASTGVRANDSDADHPLTALSVSQVGGPLTGLTLHPDGSFTFTPPSGFAGDATFTYKLNDGSADSNVATATISVVNDPPLAGADSFDTVGNTLLEVSSARTQSPAVFVSGNLLGNDSDPNGDPLTASLNTASAGAEVTVNSNGTFTYLPAVGNTGPTDTFTYDVFDGTATTTGTVTITINSMIWFVNNQVAAGGDGRSNNPFNRLSGSAPSAEDSSGVGDTIYLFTGDGTDNNQDTGITLKNAQRLVGEGVPLIVPFTLNGVFAPSLRDAGTKPKITNTTLGGDGVSVSEISVEIMGLDLAGSNNAIDITKSLPSGVDHFVSIKNSTISAAGAEGIDINGAGTGTLFADLENLAVTSTGNAIDARTTAAQMRLRLASLSDIKSSAGSAVFVDGSVGGTLIIYGFNNVSVHGDTAQNGIQINTARLDEQPDIAGQQALSGGNLVIGTATNPVGLGGLLLSNVSGKVNFGDLQVYTSAGTGVRVFGTGTFTSVAGTELEVPLGFGAIVANGGPAIDANNARVILRVNEITSTNSPSSGISLTGGGSYAIGRVTGALTTGSITGAIGVDFNADSSLVTTNTDIDITNTANRSVSLTNLTGASQVFFNGSISDTAIGILLNNNSASTQISFFGGLTLDTGTNNALTATSAGQLTVTGSTNAITTTTGTALNVTNTTIGSSGLIFQSISSNGGSNTGIILDNTGSLGGLTVTGGATAASGGTIANKSGADGSTSTGIGIYLNNTASVSLNRMQLNDFQNFAIRGNSVDGFSLSNSVINGSNGTNDATPFNESSISFNNLTGSASVSNTNVSGGFANNVRVVNTSGTLNRLTFSSVTIGANSTSNGNDGIGIEGQSTSVMNVTVQNSFFTSARGDLFQMGHIGSGSADLVFTGNTLSNNHPGIATGGGGVTLGNGSTSTMTMNVSSNSFRDAVGTAVLIVKDIGTGSLSGTFGSNSIGVAGVANSGSLEGDGLKIQQAGQGSVTMAVTNNQVRQYNNQGINLQAGAGIVAAGTFNLTVTGNTITNPGTNPAIGLTTQGLHLNNGVTPGDSFQTCVAISGNSMNSSGRNLGEDFRLRQRQSTTVRLPGYTGEATDTTAVVAHVSGNNSGASGSATVSSPPGGGFVGGGSSCP